MSITTSRLTAFRAAVSSAIVAGVLVIAGCSAPAEPVPTAEPEALQTITAGKLTI